MNRPSVKFLFVAVAVMGLNAAQTFAQQPQRELQTGIAVTEFQKEFDAHIKQKFAPVDFASNYVLRGRVEVSILWGKRQAGQVCMQAGLKQDEMEKAINKLADEGFRLEHMTAIGPGGPPQYSAIWSKAPGQQLAVRYGYPQKEFLALHKQFIEKNYFVHRIMAVEKDRALHFTAVWEKDEVTPRELQLGLTETAFQKEVAARKKKGFRLRQAFGYVDRRYPKVACIWEKRNGPDQDVRIRMTESTLKKTNEELSKKGFQPAQIHSFAVNGRTRYIGVWEKTPAKN